MTSPISQALRPANGEPDDFALMAAIAGRATEGTGGESAAFSTLSDRWRPRVVNFLKGLGADLHGAEDCAQETLLRVYRYRHEYRPDVPFPAFLFTLARRSFLDWRRRVVRWSSRSAPLPDDEPGLAPTSNESVAADPASVSADRIDLAAALATLPRRLRDVVELGTIRGLAYERVAAVLGIPVGTVKSRMHHAVERLRKALGDGADPSR
jgi:RNA polymerase sigma-70 factor, ECF subfamily